MKKIKIFLASSIREFQYERNLIGDTIRKLQDYLIDDGIRINLFECEFADNSISNRRKQEIYNEELSDTDIFIMLVGKTIGEFTLEEYNEAKKRGVKNIAIIFKDLKYDIKVENLKNALINEEIYNYKTDLELVNAIKSIINTKLEV